MEPTPSPSPAAAAPPFEIGGVLSDAWSLYRRFFVRFVTIAAVVYVAIGLVQALVTLATGEGGVLTAILWSIIGAIVGLVGYFLLQGALVLAVDDVRDGRADRELGDLFRAVQPLLGALIVAGVLAALGIGLGLILLIVPGLYLLTRWILIIPVIVLEGRSAGESFGRSSELVKGNGWNVFGLIAVTFVGLAIVGAILTGIISVIIGFLPTFLVNWVANVVVNSLLAPFIALAWTLTYFRLRGEPVPTEPADATSGL
jgi:hypothetical protein